MKPDSRIWLVFLGLLLPASLLILGSTWLFVQMERDHVLGRLRGEEKLEVGVGRGVLANGLEDLTEDIRYLAGGRSFKRLLAGATPEARTRLEEEFLQFLEAKPGYDQIRWIDAGGREVLLAGRGGAATVVAEHSSTPVEPADLAAVMALAPGALHLLPMSLSGGAGTAEEPHHLLLRVATPVADGAGSKQGMLVLDVSGSRLFSRFEMATRPVADHLALVDGDGYWLHSSNREEEWGQSFGEESRRLARRYPQAWARLAAASGQFEDEQGLWTFDSLWPLRDEGDEGNYRWIVVAHLPRATVDAALAVETRDEWLLGFLALLLATVGSAYLARSRARQQVLQERFRAVFDNASAGMANLDAGGRWLLVNSALCGILGREVSELKQTTWLEVFHPDDRRIEAEQFAALESGAISGYAAERRLLDAGGQCVHALVAVRAVRRGSGALDGLAVVIEDISERVAAEEARRQASITLSRFIDHLPGLAYVKDANCRVIAANRSFRTMRGIDPASMLGRRTEEFLPQDVSERITAADARVLASGRTEVIELDLDGHQYEITKFIIPREDGPPDLGGVAIDITERRQAEDKLRFLAARSAMLLELPTRAEELPENEFMQYGLEAVERLTASAVGFMHFVNDDGESIELVAWSRNTLRDYCTAAFDNHYPLSQAGLWADAARLRQPVVINDYASAEGKHGLPDGHAALIRLVSVPVIEGNAVRMVTGVGNKTTEYGPLDLETVQLIGNEVWRIVRRRRAEQALRVAMQVVNASPVVCFRWAATEGWPVVFVSDNVVQWGYTVEQIRAGRPAYARIIHPDDLGRVTEEMTRYSSTGVQAFEQEYRIVAGDGRVIWVIDRTTVGRAADGSIDRYDGVLTDITERKLQQLELAANLDAQRRLNKRLEEAHNQLLQSEKMASIGQLAAGVAHELNNPIGFVHSNLGTLEGYLHDLMAVIDTYDQVLAACSDADSQGRRIALIKEERDFGFVTQDMFSLVAESKEGLDRVRRIVQDLKSFSRVGEQEWKESDLHQGLDSTLTIVWNELKYKCKVEKDYGDIPPVYCLISQLNQVFMNLLVNAGQAIDKQGTITIRTRRQGEDMVCIEITDTGKGIDAAVQKRIFEPFFTTKPIGKGTGLGLSVSYGIVERHRGRIEFDSEPGCGTTFRVVLPIRPPAEASERASVDC